MPPVWSLDLPGYCVRYELIDDYIYHVQPSGYLRSAHIGPLFDMHHRAIWQLHLQPHRYVLLCDGSRLSGASIRARYLYRDGIRRIYELHPFRTSMYYGLNRLVSATIRVLRPFVPYPVQIARSFDQAMEKIHAAKPPEQKNRSRNPAPASTDPAVTGGCVIDRYAEELLYFLGCVSEGGSAFDEYRVDDDHPFLAVIDAIRLLKNDMDELLQHRRTAEDELRRNEAKYRRIFENIQDIYFETALDGTILEISPSVENYFQHRRKDLIGTDVCRLYKKTGRREAFIEAISRDDKILDFPATLMDKDGRPVECALNAFLARDEANQTATIVGSLRDISRFKKLERVLRENEERYRNLYQTSLVGLYRSRISDGKVLNANRATAEIFGFKDENELIDNYRLAETYAPERRRELLAELKKNGEVRGFEIRYTAPEGTRKDLAISAKIYPEKGYIEGVILDVTRRKATEKALRETEALYKTLFEGASDAIFIHDPETNRFSDVNRVAFQRLGFDREDLLRMTPEDITLPRIAEHIPERIRELRDREHLIYECIHVKKDGTRIPVEVSSQFIEHSGRPVILSIARDITDRKRSEAELKSAMESAEAANIAKSQFLANMSHEIRTPMNGIIGTCDLLLDSNLDARQRELLDILRASGKSLLSLINDILDLSKIEAGKLELDTTPFSVRKVMEDVADTFLPKIAGKRLELVLDIPPDLPEPVVADPLRLRQVLVNLVSNALKFTDSGEICMRVCSLEQTDTHLPLRFTVSDTGIGIAPQYHENLFDAFTQADGSITRKYGGTGLGLAICRQLVTLMQGEIGLESEPGRGSVFHFTTRFALGTANVAATCGLPDSFKPPRTLLVAPESSSRQVLIRYLAHFGFHVDAVSHGAAASAMLAERTCEKPFGLMMLETGVAAVEAAARAAEAHQSSVGPIPVILIGPPERYDRPETVPQGMTVRVLSKPIKQSALLDAIMDIFGHAPADSRSEIPDTGSTEEFHGLRLLLVEDNQINRRVATAMLQQAGIDVETMADGFQAVEALRSENFDVVLMDLQMPQMDGIEATRAIREELGLTDLPIIALTAHSMYGDREKCLEAGMNDYVSKPIDRTALYTALRRTMRRMSSRPRPDLPRAAPDPPAAVPGLDISEGLARIGGDWPLYLDILKEACDLCREMTEALAASVAAGDLDAAARSAHTLKGAAGNISAPRLHAAAKALETACKNQDARGALPLAEEIRNAHVELMRTMRQISGAPP